jgi:hypothetical protein
MGALQTIPKVHLYQPSTHAGVAIISNCNANLPGAYCHSRYKP